MFNTLFDTVTETIADIHDLSSIGSTAKGARESALDRMERYREPIRVGFFGILFLGFVIFCLSLVI